MLAISRQRRGTGRAPAEVPPGREHDIYEHQQGIFNFITCFSVVYRNISVILNW
jgi:hypothetical protein